MPAQRLAEEMVQACQEYGVTFMGRGETLLRVFAIAWWLRITRYRAPFSVLLIRIARQQVSNAFAFGVGSTAMAFALRTGLIPVTVPKVMRVIVEGGAGDVVSPKDLILHLIGDHISRRAVARRPRRTRV